MDSSVISEGPLEALCVGPPKLTASHAWELVNAFGGRVFSIAKQITQDDRAAEDVLIQTFLEICSDSQLRQSQEEL